MKASSYVGHRVSYTPDDVMFSIKGLCVGYADFSEMPSFCAHLKALILICWFYMMVKMTLSM